MKLKSLVLITAIAISGCTTPGGIPMDVVPRAKLEFTQIERIEVGKVKSEVIAQIIGKPDKVLNLDGEQEVWIYFEQEMGQAAQRLNLLIDRKSGVVASFTWILRDHEALRQKQSALSHFPNAKFSKIKEGWIAKHYYSDDTTYVDQDKGIAIYVDATTQAVYSISISANVDKTLARHD
jgi:hypothetical protein